MVHGELILAGEEEGEKQRVAYRAQGLKPNSFAVLTSMHVTRNKLFFLQVVPQDRSQKCKFLCGHLTL